MKPEHVSELVQYRLEQARAALSDAEFLLDGGDGSCGDAIEVLDTGLAL